MRARQTAMFAALGCVAALGFAAPAAAADAPTISAPASRQGYGNITLTGTAPAGATVELYESAYKFNDFYPSPDYDRGAGTYVTTTANGSGSWQLTRLLDSGFRFYVRAGGAESNRVSVAMGIVPSTTMTATNGTVNVNVEASPGQPGLRVHIQRSSGGTWSDVADGFTADGGLYSTSITGQGSGTQHYRTVIDADADNNLLRGQGDTIELNVSGGSGSGGGTTTPTTPTTPPTTPKPPAPKPTTPSVAKGAVQFSKIQYNSPGKDSGSNTSLNAEWVRVTNKTKATINLKGWTLRDASGKVYTFSSDYKLGAGKYGYVRTGKGTNGSHRYWGRTGYVWNNGGDTAYLRSSTGKTIDSCKWGNGSGVTYC